MKKRQVACIVLNWNGGHETIRCMHSLLASEGVTVNILVVDNGSTDGSDRMIADSFPVARVLKNNQNDGVAKAWNVGIRWAMEQNEEILFFLNNDAHVSLDCLAHLVESIERTVDVGIVSPRIVDGTNPGRIWFDGGFVNYFGDPVHRSLSRASGRVSEEFQEDFSTGCAMLTRVEVFKRVGFLDERFFAYSEDADFSLRARKEGFRIVHNPKAVVVHRPSTSTIRNKGKWFRDYYVTRNKLLLARKHSSGIRWSVFVLYFALRYAAVPLVYHSVTGQFRRVMGVVSGIGDFIAGRFGGRYS